MTLTHLKLMESKIEINGKLLLNSKNNLERSVEKSKGSERISGVLKNLIRYAVEMVAALFMITTNELPINQPTN